MLKVISIRILISFFKYLFLLLIRKKWSFKKVFLHADLKFDIFEHLSLIGNIIETSKVNQADYL